MSLDIAHKKVIVTLHSLYPCLLSRGSALATPEDSEDVQGAGLLWFTCKAKLQLLEVKWCRTEPLKAHQKWIETRSIDFTRQQQERWCSVWPPLSDFHFSPDTWQTSFKSVRILEQMLQDMTYFTTRFTYSYSKKTLKRLEVRSSLEADQIDRGFKIKAQHNTTWDFTLC